ncbi:hypothetical protein [Vibrio phage BUCT194]|uniref:Uncharacterized protein n=1 Tax=Vibrio phage BUCT194 TaxID=2859072 RepID=A0AAE8XFT9_9CAUD|nr:hypothetical protein PP741_gp051 [Vibrio phage BUCT194]UAW01174.1 hypothetical protein [Vibrio phage BUCT194]
MLLLNTYQDTDDDNDMVFMFFIKYSLYIAPHEQDILSKLSSESAWLETYPYYKVRTR